MLLFFSLRWSFFFPQMIPFLIVLDDLFFLLSFIAVGSLPFLFNEKDISRTGQWLFRAVLQHIRRTKILVGLTW